MKEGDPPCQLVIQKTRTWNIEKNLNTKDLGLGSWHQGRETQIVVFRWVEVYFSVFSSCFETWLSENVPKSQ